MTIQAHIHPCNKAAERDLAHRIVGSTSPMPALRLPEIEQSLQRTFRDPRIAYRMEGDVLALLLNGRSFITFSTQR